jgi:hypothetical protein
MGKFPEEHFYAPYVPVPAQRALGALIRRTAYGRKAAATSRA